MGWMDEIREMHLDSERVFEFFGEIAAIPHGSRNTAAISDYLVDFAESRRLEHYRDAGGNVVIIEEASEGYEDAEPLILQGHMDMVCEKEDGCDIDFEKDGLDLYVDGDYLRARGTTLGGDDGIAIAYALAIMDSDDVSHPWLEAVFTVDEEIGMLGAQAIDLSMLRGHRMLNIDSDVEGHFLTSCAGGMTVETAIPVRRILREGTLLKLRVFGLLGGHSGSEIDKERANANMVMGRLLAALEDAVSEAGCVVDGEPGRLDGDQGMEGDDMGHVSDGHDHADDVTSYGGLVIESLHGGLKDNAIPRECSATILIPHGCAEQCRHAVAEFVGVIRREYADSDPDICIEIDEVLNNSDIRIETMGAQSNLDILIGNSDAQNSTDIHLEPSEARNCYRVSGAIPADAPYVCLAQKAEKKTSWRVTDSESTRKIIFYLRTVPDGVQHYSRIMPGLVETSLNNGILALDGAALRVTASVRSSVSSRKEEVRDRLSQLAEYLGGSVTVSGDYPAWEYREKSPLRDAVTSAYEELAKKKPVFESIHAGLECGILSAKIPDLDCVSFGPDNLDIHTPNERLSILSVERMWEFLALLLDGMRQ